MSGRDVLLQARGLRVDRGRRRVLEDVTLELGAGEALAVVGPNAAGKSTLVQALAGLLEPAAGKCGSKAARSPPGRGPRAPRTRARHLARRWPGQPERGRARGARPLPAPGAVPGARRGRPCGRRARDPEHRHRPPGRAPARHALGRRAPARDARARPRAGASGAAARRAGRTPRRGPPAPALPRRSTRCAGPESGCSPWSTTSPARPPGPSACCSCPAAGSRPRAPRTPCSRARPPRRPSASRSAAWRSPAGKSCGASKRELESFARPACGISGMT